MLSVEEKQHLQEQIAVSKSLAMGFVFSLMPVAGFGSVVAIAIGVRSAKKINASKNELSGNGMVIWCITAGIIGLVLNAWYLGQILLKN